MTETADATSTKAGSRRERARNMPALLRVGLRPFFLMGAVWAVIAISLWLATLTGLFALPSAMNPVAWHQHEMLFGFASAIIAGFLLTAVPNWTGRPPVAGFALAALASLWLAGRLAMLLSDIIGAPLAALIDAAFLFVLALLIAREIISGSNWRNLPPALVIGLLATANAVFHLEQQYTLDLDGLGARLGVAAIAMLIGLIGGRIVPSFTRNWLAKRQSVDLPSPFGIVDKLALLLLATALIAWIAAPECRLSGGLLAAAGIAHTFRLARWSGWRCLAEPLVLILHIGYAWLAVGVGLLGLANLAPALTDLAALHALTTGAFGTMILAVMTRATLGHNGHPLAADGWTVVIYATVTAGAIVRVLSPLLPGQVWLQAAGLLWAGAFLLFTLIYGPMLLGSRKPTDAS